MSVRDGYDQNTVGFDAVDDAKRIAPKQVSTCAVIEMRPSAREIHDRRFCHVDFLTEPRRGEGTALGIPAGGGFSFFESFVEILKR